MNSALAARVVAIGMTILSGVVRLAANFFLVFNFGAIGALGLFNGARLKWWQALVPSMLVMVVTDVILAYAYSDGTYGLFHLSRPSTYVSFALYVLIGRLVIGNSNSPLRIGAATVMGTTQFFVLTNFFSWLELSDPRYATDFMHYSPDLAGLIESYWQGLKYLRNTFAGDVIFTALAFSAQAALVREPKPVDELASRTV